MVDLVCRSLGPRIQVELRFAPDLPAALVDSNQLELALLNLAVNARDAMPGGGSLAISVDSDAVDADRGLLRQGKYVRISVADTGVGMDAETLKRATEPFFTTKGVGRGTGLGLSAVQGLAVQSGGEFRLESRPGRGTSATLWLPVSASPAVVAPLEDAAPALRLAKETTLLLIDDEELVRAGTADMLSDAGYTVVEAASGYAAIQLVKDGLAPDAVVTDYAMPGMTGTELARELRRLKPDLPVLLITGYATLSDRDAVGLPRLAKPFRQADLSAAVAELVGSGRVQLLPVVTAVGGD